MKIICGWCGEFLRTVRGPSGLVSHGCCAECARKLLETEPEKP